MPGTTSDSSRLTQTDITRLGRQGVIVAIAMIVLLIVGRFLFTTIVLIYKTLNPPAPPPPTVGFGVLPALRFPEVIESDKPTSYQLETPSGTVPTFSDRAKVFFMPRSSFGLLADQSAREFAADFGFIFEPEILSVRLYRWTKAQPLATTFQLDIQSYQMKLTTSYLSTPNVLLNSQLPDSNEALNIVKNYVNKTELLGKDIATASGEVVYLKNAGGELAPAVSFSDADYLQIDINRYPIDGRFRMYTPRGYQGVISAIVGGSFKGEENIYELSYNYHPVDYSEIHTYPLRTSSEAWQVLQAGQGFIANPASSGTAVIREVQLGYYDDFEEQSYLQPIYVFIGDDGFLGYVPALSQSWVQREQLQ